MYHNWRPFNTACWKICCSDRCLRLSKDLANGSFLQDGKDFKEIARRLCPRSATDNHKVHMSTSFLCLGRVTFHASPTFFLRGICHGTLIPKRLGEWWILEVGSSSFVGWIFPRLSLTRQGFKNFQQQYFKAEDVALIDFILEPRKTSDARYVYQWCLPYWYGMSPGWLTTSDLFCIYPESRFAEGKLRGPCTWMPKIREWVATLYPLLR